MEFLTEESKFNYYMKYNKTICKICGLKDYVNFANPYNLVKLYNLDLRKSLSSLHITIGDLLKPTFLEDLIIKIAKYISSKDDTDDARNRIVNAIKNEKWEELDKFGIINKYISDKKIDFNHKLYNELENACGLTYVCKKVFHKYIGLNGKPMTYREIAEEYNVSIERIRRIYNKISKKIKLIDSETYEEYPLATAYIYGLCKIVPDVKSKTND